MLPEYREKWRSFAISTEPINKQKVAAVIKAAYSASNFPEPEILFYESPFAAIKAIFAIDNFQDYLGKDIHGKFHKRVLHHLVQVTRNQFEEITFRKLNNKINYPDFPHYWTEENPIISYFPYAFGISKCMEIQLVNNLVNSGLYFADILDFTKNMVRTVDWSILGCMFDFCISVLGVGHDKTKWEVMKDLIQHCGFIFQFEKVYISCNRPCKLSFDKNNRLHGEGEPAIKFHDGYSIYARHGEQIYEQY